MTKQLVIASDSEKLLLFMIKRIIIMDVVNSINQKK